MLSRLHYSNWTCAREKLYNHLRARHCKISTYVRNTCTHTNHGFKSPDGNQLIVSVGVWNRRELVSPLRCMTSVCVSRSTWSSTQSCATQHEETHFAVVVINDWLRGLPYTERPRIIVMVDRGLFDHFRARVSSRISERDNSIPSRKYWRAPLANQDMKITVDFQLNCISTSLWFAADKSHSICQML